MEGRNITQTDLFLPEQIGNYLSEIVDKSNIDIFSLLEIYNVIDDEYFHQIRDVDNYQKNVIMSRITDILFVEYNNYESLMKHIQNNYKDIKTKSFPNLSNDNFKILMTDFLYKTFLQIGFKLGYENIKNTVIK